MSPGIFCQNLGNIIDESI